MWQLFPGVITNVAALAAAISGGGGAGDAAVASTLFALNTSTGNQVIPIDLGGATPKAVRFDLSLGLSDKTGGTGTALVAAGFSDGTTSYAGYARTSQQNSNHKTGSVIFGHDGTSAFEATLVSFDADSVTINITTAPSSGFKVLMTAYAGENLQAKVNVGTVAVSPGTTVSVGFQPELVMGLSTNNALGADTARGSFSAGFASATAQASWAQRGRTDFSSIATAVSTALLMQQEASTSYLITASNFTSSGFTATASASAGTDQFAFLSLSWGGEVSVNVGQLAASTSTGNSAKTGVGFQPTHLLLALNGGQSSTGVAGIINGFSYIDADEAKSIFANCSSSGASPSSGYSEASIYNVDTEAALSSFDSDGFTLNYSNAGSLAYLWPYAALRIA